MSIQTLKILISGGAALLAGYLGLFIYRTMQEWDEVKEPVSREQQEKYLDPGQVDDTPRDDLVNYDDVTRTFIELDWTGAPEPVVVEGPPPETAPAASVEPKIEKLLTVLFIQVDTSDSAESLASVRYTDPALAQAATAGVRGASGVPLVTLKIGNRLPKPHEYARVAAVEPEGVVFAFDNPEWKDQTVEPERFETRIRILPVGPGGPILPSAAPRIPTATGGPFRPKYTQLVGENRYRLGTDDAQRIGENYAEYLTRDVQYREWRDPRTGRRAGIQIEKVQPGSLIEAHGAKDGDIIKSINGHPVTSASEAITYVKNNAETTSVWEILVVNKGVERTVVYESPPE